MALLMALVVSLLASYWFQIRILRLSGVLAVVMDVVLAIAGIVAAIVECTVAVAFVDPAIAVLRRLAVRVVSFVELAGAFVGPAVAQISHSLHLKSGHQPADAPPLVLRVVFPSDCSNSSYPRSLFDSFYLVSGCPVPRTP